MMGNLLTIVFNTLKLGYQLKISDVHFRYEDDLTVPGSGVVLGLQIESLTAHSCDESWTVGAVSKDKTNCFKLLQLNNLGVYWDNVPLDQLLGDLSIPELSVILLNIFYTLIISYYLQVGQMDIHDIKHIMRFKFGRGWGGERG